MRHFTKDQNDHFTYKRLSFFAKFLQAMHMSYSDCGKILGITRAAVCHMFKFDDTFLSTIHQVATACGYRLHVSLARSDNNPADAQIVAIEDCLRLSGVRIRSNILTFLLVAMSRYSISKRQLAMDVDVTTSTVFRWFRREDIKISALATIAAKENLILKFEFVKMEDDTSNDEMPESTSSIEYSIAIQERYHTPV